MWLNPFTHAPSQSFPSETFDAEEWNRSKVWLEDEERWYEYSLGAHYGYDGGAAGEDLYVPGPGVVVESGFPPDAFGNRATIRLANGLFFHHNHMRDPALIPPDTPVRGGELIGHVGQTGNVGGPHDHKTLTSKNAFEAGAFVDPGPWLREMQHAMRAGRWIEMTLEQFREEMAWVIGAIQTGGNTRYGPDGSGAENKIPGGPNLKTLASEVVAIKKKLGVV